MKLHFIGTAAENLPYPGHQHCCWILESSNTLFCFNAGEGCSRTAFFMDLKLTEIGAVFLSEITPCRCGGLMNLLELSGDPAGVPVFVPDQHAGLPTDLGTRKPMLCEGSFCLYGVRISWFPSGELPAVKFFLIEAENRRIIYAPGIRSAEELCPFLKNGADLLLAGSPDLTPAELCRYLKHRHLSCGRIIFIDHTLDTLSRRDEYLDRISDMMPGKVFFAEDAWSIEL